MEKCCLVDRGYQPRRQHARLERASSPAAMPFTAYQDAYYPTETVATLTFRYRLPSGARKSGDDDQPERVVTFVSAFLPPQLREAVLGDIRRGFSRRLASNS